MHVASKAERRPLVQPWGETVFELVGRPADHGGAAHSLAHIILAPGHASARHYHHHTEETYYLLAGTAEMVIDERTLTLDAGQACLIVPGERHQIFNRGAENLEFLAVCAPAWAPDDSIPA